MNYLVAVCNNGRGQICVRGDAVMHGYWKRTEETAAVLVDGWCRTGDAGYLDDQGFLYIVDRMKDMIITGGENVYSAEVENALGTHPSAVIGLPSENWGETVHAVVVPRSNARIDFWRTARTRGSAHRAL